MNENLVQFASPTANAAAFAALIRAASRLSIHLYTDVGLEQIAQECDRQQAQHDDLHRQYASNAGWRLAARFNRAVAAAIREELAERAKKRAQPQEITP